MIQKTLNTAALLLLTALSFAQGVLNERTLMQFGRVSEPRVSPDGKYAIYGVRHPDVVANNTYNEIYIQWTAPGSKPELLLDRTWNAVSAKFTPDGKRVGFLSAKGGSMQLWECPLTGKDGKQITRDLEGLNGFVYSPDGKYLVFFKDVQIIKAPKDTYANLPKTTGRVYDELNYRHWDTWEDGYYSHIFVAEYASPDKSKDIMANEQYDAPNPPDAGEEDLAISPDGSTMVYSCKKLLNRVYMKSTNTDLYAYDFKKGTTTNLTSGNKGYDTQPAFSPNSTTP